MTQIVTSAGFVPDTFADVPLVSLAEYQGTGALLMSLEDEISEVAGHFDTLNLIVVPFPKSADGRGFSIAKSLRELGFSGYLRARGHVLVDQFRAALRCGFDDVEISGEQAQRNPEAQWRAVPFDQSYQTLITNRDARP